MQPGGGGGGVTATKQHPHPHPPYRGIINTQGTSCHTSSALQLLFHCFPKFRAAVLELARVSADYYVSSRLRSQQRKRQQQRKQKDDATKGSGGAGEEEEGDEGGEVIYQEFVYQLSWFFHLLAYCEDIVQVSQERVDKVFAPYRTLLPSSSSSYVEEEAPTTTDKEAAEAKEEAAASAVATAVEVEEVSDSEGEGEEIAKDDEAAAAAAAREEKVPNNNATTTIDADDFLASLDALMNGSSREATKQEDSDVEKGYDGISCSFAIAISFSRWHFNCKRQQQQRSRRCSKYSYHGCTRFFRIIK